MARGFPRPVDGSIPIQALLYNDEEPLASQDNVGIYYKCVDSPPFVFRFFNDLVLKNLPNTKMERSMSQPTASFTSMLNAWWQIRFKWIFR